MHDVTSSTIAFDSASRRHKDANGYLHVDDTPLTKAQVAPYFGREIPGWRDLGLDPERRYGMYRPAEELEKSLALWRGLPVLLRHEKDSAEAPQKELRVGSVGTRPAFDGTYLRNDLEIHDAIAIAGIEDESQRQISAGYRYTPVMETGEFEGVPYEIVMRDIRPNHVALVRKGRAGPDVLVEDSAPDSGAEKPVTHEDKFMKVKMVARKIAQALLAGTTGKKPVMATDADPEAVAATVAEVVEAVLEEEQKSETPPAGTDNAAGGAAPGGGEPEGGQAKDNGLAAKLKELLAPLLEGKTDISGKSVDAYLADLAAALATDNAPEGKDNEPGGEPAKDNGQAHDALPKGLKTAKPGMAFDAAALVADVEKQVAGRYRAKEQAAQEVKPLVGAVSVMAFDSADGIYGYALEKRGIAPAQYPPSAWRGIVQGLIAARAEAAQTVTASMAFDSKTEGPLAGIDTSRFTAV